MRKKRAVLVAVLLLLAVVCAGVGISRIINDENKSQSLSVELTELTEISTVKEEAQESEQTAAEVEEEEYVSPIDFESLWEINEDIYAWIEIPGADVSYPILQHPTEEEYYLSRDIEGNSDSNGSIFTQATYNSQDMTDLVTVIYGHNMNSGAMFGTLQETYSDAEQFKACNEIVIYLPDEELHYQVFAAVPYSDLHIMDYYDFSSEYQFTRFLSSVESVRGFGVNYDDSVEVAYGDHIIVLSTCQDGGSGRYLVLAKLVISDL